MKNRENDQNGLRLPQNVDSSKTQDRKKHTSYIFLNSYWKTKSECN